MCFFGQFCFGSKDTLTVAIFCGCASKRFADRFSLLGFFGAMAKTEPTCLQDLATEMDQAVAEAVAEASSPVFNNFSMDILQTYLPTYNRKKNKKKVTKKLTKL